MEPLGGPHCHDISVKIEITECGMCAWNDYRVKVQSVHTVLTFCGNLRVNRGASTLKMDLEVMVRM
jgi:hypothetical protein